MEISSMPFIDAVQKVTGKAIAQRGEEFVYMDNKAVVEASVLSEAEAIKAEDYTKNLKAHYKALYLKEVDKVLTQTDYDSIATVKVWKDDATFGAEASDILTWYKSLIDTNYAILNAVQNNTKFNSAWAEVIPTDVEYLAELPTYGA